MEYRNEELNKLFDSFDSVEESLQQGKEGEDETFQNIDRYIEIPEYVDQDKIVVISKEKRIDNFSNQISVQGESDSQYILFEMERYYDGIDLSDKIIQVHYERPDGKGDNSAVINVQMSDTKIRFGWLVPAYATEISGILKVMPYVFGSSNVSVENLYILKEMYSEYRINPGLEIDGGITEPTEEWYTQFVSTMLDYVRRVESSVQEIGSSVTDAKRFRDEAEQIVNSIDGVQEEVEEAGTYVVGVKTEVQEIKQEIDLSKESAENSSLMSKSYSEGGTGIRPNESNNNAKYFMEQAQRLVEAVGTGGLIPAGTITFEEIPETPITGHMYNISNSFVTDDRFEDGEGYRYKSGVNVYWTLNGKLDVLSGVPPTKEDIGLGNVPNVSTDNQTPTFTRAEVRENIISGEKLSVLFGKLNKVIFDLSEVAFSGNYNDLSETPDSLPASDTTDEYNPVGNEPISGAGVKKALDESIGLLDVPSKGGEGKYIQSISEVDGKIIAVEENMPSIPSSASDIGAVGTEEYEEDMNTVNGEINKLKANIANVSIPSTWEGTEAPFTVNIGVSGVTVTSIIEVDVQNNVTSEQLDAYINAKIVEGSQGTNSITLKAFGEKPTIEIPIKVVVRKV